ncbi:MAG TPA: GntR family transcriptional regulator [Solirubrobacterales bacterium]
MAFELQPPVVAAPPTFGSDRVSERVTSYLRDLILCGQLRGGESLRVEHLAESLEVSITPIRESLVELLGEGFVERTPRRGYKVARLSRKDIADVFAANGLLAGELAELQKQLRSAGSRDAYAEMEQINNKMHRIVDQAAASPKLAWFAQRTSHYEPHWTWSTVQGWPKASINDHRAVLKALEARDPDAAREAMGHQIRHSGELLVDHLAEQGFWDERDGGNGRAAAAAAH